VLWAAAGACIMSGNDGEASRLFPAAQRPFPEVEESRLSFQASIAKQLRAGRMKIEVDPSREAAGQAAAQAAAAAIVELADARGAIAVIFATGASQFATLAALTAMQNLPWARVTAFHMDEYIGLPADHPGSLRQYLRERLTGKVRILPPVSLHRRLATAARRISGCPRPRESPEKRIARAAAALVQENETIGFSAGTTTTLVARQMLHRKNSWRRTDCSALYSSRFLSHASASFPSPRRIVANSSLCRLFALRMLVPATAPARMPSNVALHPSAILSRDSNGTSASLPSRSTCATEPDHPYG
jgi:hypothetical protein